MLAIFLKMSYIVWRVLKWLKYLINFSKKLLLMLYFFGASRHYFSPLTFLQHIFVPNSLIVNSYQKVNLKIVYQRLWKYPEPLNLSKLWVNCVSLWSFISHLLKLIRKVWTVSTQKYPVDFKGQGPWYMTHRPLQQHIVQGRMHCFFTYPTISSFYPWMELPANKFNGTQSPASSHPQGSGATDQYVDSCLGLIFSSRRRPLLCMGIIPPR